jgi:hypothetical protein
MGGLIDTLSDSTVQGLVITATRLGQTGKCRGIWRAVGLHIGAGLDDVAPELSLSLPTTGRATPGKRTFLRARPGKGHGNEVAFPEEHFASASAAGDGRNVIHR